MNRLILFYCIILLGIFGSSIGALAHELGANKLVSGAIAFLAMTFTGYLTYTAILNALSRGEE